MPDEILGVHELAQLAGVSDSTMRAYVSRGQCPEPDWRLACGPIWAKATADAWVASRDDRLERMRRKTARLLERETKAAENMVAFQTINRREVNYRTARNKLAARGRSKYSALPTMRQECRMLAEGMIARGDSSLPEGVLSNHDWSDGILRRRENLRMGAPDGIPF